MENIPKKCPVCNSSRVSATAEGFECKRCGYVNKGFEDEE